MTEITGFNLIPSSFQFFEGDHIIKIKFDGTLELGSVWADNNDVATAIFNQIVDHVMPAWKREVRMEERAAIVAWLRSGGCWETIPYDVEEVYSDAADDIEAGEHLK